MQKLTSSVDFISHAQIAGLHGVSLYDYLLDQVSEEKVLLIEAGLNPNEQLALVQRGMERYSSDFSGVKMLALKMQGASRNKFFKSKNKRADLLLVAPASTLIEQSKGGNFSIKLKSDETCKPDAAH